ncbi:radical SAM protein [Streptomyces varsoviensis]|uniref:radical SAM protein n=1 Tax=Streptomyces varsoviensis TaxID=67373 RepID=UPI0033CED3C7
MKIAEKKTSADGSVKYLWQVPSSGSTVESIYYQLGDEPHTCISTEAGCNVGCVFCETGKQRNLGDLTSQEIYDQVALTAADLPDGVPGGRFTKVVVAGMGEPLLNFDNLRDAATRLLADGLTEQVTVTTSGIVPQMRRLPSMPISLLSVSLHATTNEVRTRLIPTNKTYSLEDVVAAAREYRLASGVPVIMNYLLFDGVNDTDADLDRLVELLDRDVFSVKLKSWNEVPDAGLIPSPSARYEHFRDGLDAAGFDVSICVSAGVDVGGGCGQLRSVHREMKRARRTFVGTPSAADARSDV